MNRFSDKALPLARIVYRSPPNSVAWHQAASDLVAGQPGASFWAGSSILPVWLTSQQLAQNLIQASPARHKSGNDRGRNAGSKSIFYPDNLAKLKNQFAIAVLTPDELLRYSPT